VVPVAGAKGVVASLRAEAVAIVGDEGMAREKLEAVAEGGATTMREKALDEGGRGAGIERRNRGPGVVAGVTQEGLVLLPEEKGPIPRAQRRGGGQGRLYSFQNPEADVAARHRRPRLLEETQLHQRRRVKRKKGVQKRNETRGEREKRGLVRSDGKRRSKETVR
jgi:hypothetical protein